jgi:hypothetical protein
MAAVNISYARVVCASAGGAPSQVRTRHPLRSVPFDVTRRVRPHAHYDTTRVGSV